MTAWERTTVGSESAVRSHLGVPDGFYLSFDVPSGVIRTNPDGSRNRQDLFMFLTVWTELIGKIATDRKKLVSGSVREGVGRSGQIEY